MCAVFPLMVYAVRAYRPMRLALIENSKGTIGGLTIDLLQSRHDIPDSCIAFGSSRNRVDIGPVATTAKSTGPARPAAFRKDGARPARPNVARCFARRAPTSTGPSDLPSMAEIDSGHQQGATKRP
jgi:hypothetical protein